LISGDLTNKERIILEERTAFLLNLAGFVTQEQLSLADSGVSTRKLYKILANVVIDWYWLSHKHADRFRFNGVGEIVWIPHKFSALGQISPSIEYKDVPLYFGLFPNIVELFKSRVYSKYGVREIRSVGKQTYILFPTYIDYAIRNKSRVEHQEQHYWERLIKVYSAVDDTTLDALASCRTGTLSSHSLWIQFVLWKRYMGFAIDYLRRENEYSINNLKKKLLEYIDAAGGCIGQIFTNIDYIDHLDEYTRIAQQVSFSDEFSSLIPCRYEMPSDLFGKSVSFVECSYVLEALHDICTEFQALIKLGPSQRPPDLMILEDRLKYIAEHTSIKSILVDVARWYSLFLDIGSRKEIANLIWDLSEAIFKQFEERLGILFERPSGHYKTFLEKYYPLPRDNFIRGH
jgi:hypothetical protein